MSDVTGYSRLQIVLHWAIALGVVFNYIFSDGMERAFDSMMETQAAPDLQAFLHIWVGIAILALVVLRLVVRFGRGAPSAEAGMAGTVARVGHGLLYLLMFAVPVGGAITWFLSVDATGELHAIGANALMILAAGHSLIALYHQFIRKDGLLLRMMRPE